VDVFGNIFIDWRAVEKAISLNDLMKLALMMILYIGLSVNIRWNVDII
jgi:hypothetical protein